MTVPQELVDAHHAAARDADGEGDPTTRYDLLLELAGWHRDAAERVMDLARVGHIPDAEEDGT